MTRWSPLRSSCSAVRIGVLGSTVNPFATGIASGFADTSISEGVVGRLVILVIGTIIGIVFVMRYAARVKADPSRSLVYDQKAANEAQFRTEDASGGAARRAGTDDGSPEGGARPLLPRLRRDDLRRHPMGGPRHRAADALVVVPGDDRLVPRLRDPHRGGRTAVRERLHRDLRGRRARPARRRAHHRDRPRDHRRHDERFITDTVLNAAEQAVADLGGAAFINLVYGVFIPLSFLIPSSSGLATVAMPIMAPLASFADVPSYLVVTAYQSANGLVNLVTPTSAVVMGGLAIARVGYGTWLKFVWPVLALLAILTVAVLTVSVLI